jgi:hypothetical protein
MSGLTEAQAKEFHAAFMKYFIGSVFAAILAHIAVGVAAGPWWRF